MSKTPEELAAECKRLLPVFAFAAADYFTPDDAGIKPSEEMMQLRDEYRHQAAKLRNAIDRLAAVASANAEDAARYRWLRDRSLIDIRSALDVGDLTTLDFFIDAARKEQA